MFGLRLNDSSSRLILLANIIVLVIALYLKYSIAMLIWLYWLESLAVGILALLVFTAALRQKKSQGWRLALVSAVFFAFNYCVFHLSYVIIAMFFPSLGFDWARLYDFAPAAALLIIPHVSSFYRDGAGKNKGNVAVYVSSYVGVVYGRAFYIAMIMLGATALAYYMGSERMVLLPAMLLKLFVDMQVDQSKKKKLGSA